MSSALSALSVLIAAVSAPGAGGNAVVKMASSPPVVKQAQYQSGAIHNPGPATPVPMAHSAGPPVVSMGGGGGCGGCGGGCSPSGCHRQPKFSFWAYWGLPNHHHATGNLHQHIPYIAYPKDYYYFRPYNYFQIADQQQEVLNYGGDPRNPYDNRFFKRAYEQVLDPALGAGPEFIPPGHQ